MLVFTAHLIQSNSLKPIYSKCYENLMAPLKLLPPASLHSPDMLFSKPSSKLLNSSASANSTSISW